MLIDQVFFYFLVGIGIILSLPALWLLMRARWTSRFEKLRVVSEKSVLLSFAIGIIPVMIVGSGVAFVIRKVKSGDVGALVVDVLLVGSALSWALAGLAGLATLIGEKLSSASLNDPFKATLRGGIVLVLCFSMPFIGWFALLPIAIITGAGMNVRSWFVKANAAN